MLFLLRHGRTAPNAAGLLLGRADPALDLVGREQAARAAEVVAGARRVVSSPLRRARETAEALGPPVTVDERWVELDYGAYDERPAADLSDEVWRRWWTDPSFVPPDGESLTDLGRRVRSACEELAHEAMTDDVVVVSHVSPIKAAVAWALAVDDLVAWRMRLDVGSLTRVAVGERGPVLHGYNDTSHLG